MIQLIKIGGFGSNGCLHQYVRGYQMALFNELLKLGKESEAAEIGGGPAGADEEVAHHLGWQPIAGKSHKPAGATFASLTAVDSPPNGGSFDRQAAAAPGHEELQINILI